jgi:hypothetical protein
VPAEVPGHAALIRRWAWRWRSARTGTACRGC